MTKEYVELLKEIGGKLTLRQLYNIFKREKKLIKAFGGCTNCYGKGYATVKNISVGRGYFVEADPVRPCTCDRGKQIKKWVR